MADIIDFNKGPKGIKEEKKRLEEIKQHNREIIQIWIDENEAGNLKSFTAAGTLNENQMIMSMSDGCFEEYYVILGLLEDLKQRIIISINERNKKENESPDDIT